MRLTNGSISMKAEGLRFTYQPDLSPHKAACGWGAGTLWLNGRAIWFGGGSPEAPQPLVWTWIDLLEHLADGWPHLRIESPWPLDWLAEPMREGGNFWQVADDRWQELDEAVADAEEARVLDFARRHNLAAGWQGLNVPALYWYRQGREVVLCEEGQRPVVVPFSEAWAVLEALGEAIAAGLANSAHPRAGQALAAWRARDRVDARRQVAIATGLDEETLAVIQAGQDEKAFWGLNQTANDEEFCANALLAAARMTAGRLSPERMAAILEVLRGLPAVRSLPQLDALGERLLADSWRAASTAHAQGYALAAALRGTLGLDGLSRFEPEHWLAQWGVPVGRVVFGTPVLEAIAVWGNRGPAIVVNDAPAIRPAHVFGYRFALAHEICHLLVDRQSALPAAEVLGGHVAPAIEQRANAFAAEILLPRAAAARAYRQAAALEAAVKQLVVAFEVSRKVAKAQIKNSGAASPEDVVQIDWALQLPSTADFRTVEGMTCGS